MSEEGLSNIIFEEEFRDCMYKNMWTYMNSDMIEHIFGQLRIPMKVGKKRGIYDKNFTKKEHYNKIVFKGSKNDGHYVYVNDEGKAYGTIENKLLNGEEDHGVCHGVAIIYALNYLAPKYNPNLFIDYPILKSFKLISEPKTKREFKKNYIIICKLYDWLISTGLWNNALKDNFYRDVYWYDNDEETEEADAASNCLNNYIDYLETV
jgi:hypothetical protein